ncbi:MAG: acetyl-CoA carboxylase carboxyltransferase subunit alpha [Candidatus Omnitrophica bacterium]|nr:acetyl-CoA carboxylase carboxyltransferase subunit alpha [Candidatus Omnitrophota bacterium]MCK4424016.1 acetyl-CoA carboxylase carboxyltransferase subunit alpha [Candidatus Omnitrophota bacterium]
MDNSLELDFEKPLKRLEAKIAELEKLNTDSDMQFDVEIDQLKQDLKARREKVYAKLTPWQRVQVARHANRPLIKDYISGMFSEFIELHGDRCFGDDRGIIGGLAKIGKHRVMLIGHQKGKTVEENIKVNFGMANPEGYRKALRLMKLAQKYNIPIVSLIDTPGAYPGLDAEARGQAEAIARNLTEMSTLKVPIIVAITGEGGSGGAIGIGMGDVVIMLSNSVYSVISPEGCASILWRDGSKAPEAAQALKLTADSLLDLGVIDEIIPEPSGGAHRNYEAAILKLQEAIIKNIEKTKRLSSKKLIEKRFEKYSKIGKFDKRKISSE